MLKLQCIKNLSNNECSRQLQQKSVLDDAPYAPEVNEEDAPSSVQIILYQTLSSFPCESGLHQK